MNMKFKAITYALLFLSILALIFAFMVFVMAPPNSPNEITVGFGNNDWGLDSEPVVHGRSIWNKFSDYRVDVSVPLNHSNSIKVAYENYWGAIPYNSEYMSWEVEDGVFSSNSLIYDDLIGRWQDSEAEFKFSYGDNFFQITYSIPKLEDGTNKYATLLDAWDKGDLFQIVERL